MIRSILGLALLEVAAGQDFLPCANDRGFVGRCLDPVAQGSVPFEFQPLFPMNPTFVCAFDVRDEDETEGPNVAPERMAKVGFWMEYTDHNLDPEAKQETHLAVLLNGNITGTPGGGHNGSNSIMELVKLEMRNDGTLETEYGAGHGEISWAIYPVFLRRTGVGGGGGQSPLPKGNIYRTLYGSGFWT
jgi:hypothetical protein